MALAINTLGLASTTLSDVRYLTLDILLIPNISQTHLFNNNRSMLIDHMHDIPLILDLSPMVSIIPTLCT